MSISAVILAGGKSSRMGQDKALMPFGGYPTMAEYQYRRLEPLFDKIYISAKENKFPFKANILYDNYKDSNPLNAIISSLEATDSNAIFFISVDMPFLSKKTILNLIELYKSNPNFDIYTIKSDYGLEPMATIYKKELLPFAKKLYKDKKFKLKDFINNFNYKYIEVISKDELINLNREKDYKNAQKMALLNKNI